jgi:hypothetical protein
MADLEIDDQVREVVDDMLAFRWVAGPSHAEKAAKWGVSISVVWRRASEASRFIRLCCRASEDDIRDESLRNVQRIGVKAELDGEYRDALTAQELFMRVHGLLERKPEPTEELTEEQLDAMIRARGYRKDTDASQPGTEAAGGRSDQDRGGSEEAKGRVEGFESSEE